MVKLDPFTKPAQAISTINTDVQCSSVLGLKLHPRRLGLNQQYQTSAAAPTCVSPPSDLRVKTRIAKVQKPSIESIYHEGETTPETTGVSLSWSLFPRLKSPRKTSVLSVTTRYVPQYLESGSSPVPPDHPCCHSCKQQKQTSASPSLCAHPRDNSKMKKRRSGMRISWSRLPSKRKTSEPSIPKCSVRRNQDSSTSPVPTDHSRHHDHNQQSQTLASPLHPDDSGGRRTRTTKVQKPSIESIYHVGQTTSQITGVTGSWSLLPSKRKTSETAITTCSLLQCSRLHARNEQTQTPESLCGYPSYDFKEMRNLSVKVQKPFVETIRQERFPHIKAGIVSGWFCLPSMHQASAMDSNRLKDMQSPKTSKPNTVTLFDSKPEPGSQPIDGPEPQKIFATKQKHSREICCSFKKQNLISQPELTNRIVMLLDPQVEQHPEKLANEITPVQQKLANSKTVYQKAEESVCKEDKADTPKEIKSKKKCTKMTKVFVDMRKTIIPRINEILKNLAGQKGSDNPKDPKISKEKEWEVICESKNSKPISTKYLNSPGTSKQKEQEVTTKRSEEKTKGVDSLKTIKQTEKVSYKSEKHEPNQNNATEQLPIPRQKRCTPRPPPALLGLPGEGNPEEYLYEGPSCKRVKTGVIWRLRSELTHSTSGFKACKRRKPQKSQAVDNIELDFGEAIRYFASMNPKRFQQLIQEELESQRKAEDNKCIEEKNLTERMEKVRKISEKEAKKGKVDKTTAIDKFPISDESESDYPQGLKFSIAVKDGPTALTGVDCLKINRSR